MNPQPLVTRPRIFHGYWILMVGFLCQAITHGCGSYAFSLYVIPLNETFGWNRATIMTGTLIWSLTTGLASPLAGKLTYRWGARRVITIGAILMSIGFASLSMINSLWQFCLLYAVVGIGGAATGVVPTSTVLANWFIKRRGFAIGILCTGIGVGGFLVPRLLSNFVIPDFSYQGGYLACGILSAAILIPLSLWLVKEKPEDMGLLPDNGNAGEVNDQLSSETINKGIQLTQARKTQAFWLMAVAFFAFSFAGGLIFQNQVPHLEDVGFPAIAAASALQGVGIGSAIGKFAFGWLCDYIRPKYILVIGGVLQTTGTFILINITGSSPLSLLWAYGILIGLGIGSWLPAVSMNTSFNFGFADYGVIFGVFNLVFMSAGAIGPVVGGYIFDTAGNYYPGFQLSIIVFIVSMISMLLVRRPADNFMSNIKMH